MGGNLCDGRGCEAGADGGDMLWVTLPLTTPTTPGSARRPRGPDLGVERLDVTVLVQSHNTPGGQNRWLPSWCLALAWLFCPTPVRLQPSVSSGNSFSNGSRIDQTQTDVKVCQDV